ncbi:TonB-dependent receptor [Arundinibacter roseus]|uniref:TonB-dependent receptor n=1 Tax=Arundinibacter roseus TaxID=2070510 RepID=A0A4R4KKC0_9BACT|nr:TonB-dependent receptor [Arundinibacter roseus]TDB67041.1 TonB-dependent receptor [Arundinibacter roseus]
MKKRNLIPAAVGLFWCIGNSLDGFAQKDTLTATQLEEVTVQAFESRRTLLETTASVGLVTPKSFQRYAPTTFTNAVNSLPGVRMEERSPGSYRFSVRGSLLRSPFGVRNVKFYWNGIPFTDASGNTPLNSLDYGSIGRMEVIKGPGSSLYGAGTGGVVLLNTPSGAGQYGFSQAVGVGSYGFQSRNTELRLGDVSVRYGHQQQDGFRQHSGMVRDALQVNSTTALSEKSSLSILGLYSDLHYKTPGGINLDQYTKDPTLARQPTPTIPGSVTQNAGIYTRYTLLGLQHSLDLSSHWNQSISLYVNANDFANPFITNFEKRDEQGFGGRNVWNYTRPGSKIDVQWTSGFEWQYGKSSQRNYQNNAGVPGNFLTSEDIRSTNWSVFSQIELTPLENLIINAGASLNSFRYGYERFFPAPYAEDSRSFGVIANPRLAATKKIGDTWAVTASLSSGFSPPTLQEVRPSAGGFRTDLAPERGLNREIAVRRVGERLRMEIIGYLFNLNETIVRRSDEAGAEFFVNAGKTNQKGLEWMFEYGLIRNLGLMEEVKIRHSGNFVSYRYDTYQQGDVNFSGNKLPGIPSTFQMTGLDVILKNGISAFVSYQSLSKVFLNDANTVEAPGFNQLAARLIWNKAWTKHLSTELSASADWAAADIYSLGFDLNAFGNRYYNAAPKQNYWSGLKVNYVF